jgi:cell division transport system ATP-binding protein
MIVLKNVSKDYGEGKVLDNVSFRIDPGEFVCVTGPSGAGKSTLLSLLVGADTISTGSISVDGVDLRTVPGGALQIFRRRVGIVYQDYKLLGNRTVTENIAFPLEVCGAEDAVIAKRVPELIQRMQLSGRRNALPRELSGGEKARTAIARAIAHKPLILLADEPTQNLDPEQAKDVLQIFRDINAEGTTVVFATHDAALVDALHTRVIALEQGKLIRDSVGGYKPKVVAQTGKIFKENEQDERRRKVKITAIHSES